jgi:type IV secretory pathway TraG/TraD family ATPase VirD4
MDALFFWGGVILVVGWPFFSVARTVLRLRREPTNSAARDRLGRNLTVIVFGSLWIAGTAFLAWAAAATGLLAATEIGSRARLLLLIVVFFTAPAALWFLSVDVRLWVGRLLRPMLQARRMLKLGQGGSAGFGGMMDDWAAKYKPGDILLGSSLYDPQWLVGHNDDRGLLTIASSRSGKGRSAIIPNLIMWPGSALVIDPKGTNAAVTSARRGKGGYRIAAPLGQEVHVVDPFALVRRDGGSRFNPLASIKLDSPRVVEDIALIADALVVSGGDDESHWNEAARTILRGVIAHLLTAGEGRTLVDLRAALNQDAAGLDALFGDMMENQGAGGLARTAAALIDKAGPNERGSFFTTVMRNLAWLDSLAMQKSLAASDFDLHALKTRQMTVYIVLPPDLLEEHKRFMRLFVNLAIRAMSQGGKSRHPVLFVLDEFYSLGKLSIIESASGLLAGYGMKLWPIVQNIGQLQHLYPKNWETFFANAGVVQAFSINDLATAQYLVQRLGSRAENVEVGNTLVRAINALREVEEIGRDVAREKLRQIIYRSGDDPLMLGRILYDQQFSATMYSPDPDHRSPDPLSRRGWATMKYNRIASRFARWGVPQIGLTYWQRMGLPPPPGEKRPHRISLEWPAQYWGRRKALPPPAPPPPAPKPEKAALPPPKVDTPAPAESMDDAFEKLFKATKGKFWTREEFEKTAQALQEAAQGDAKKLTKFKLWRRMTESMMDSYEEHTKIAREQSAQGGAREEADKPVTNVVATDPANPWKGWKRGQESAPRRKKTPKRRDKGGEDDDGSEKRAR